VAGRTDQETHIPASSSTRPDARRPWFQFRLRTLLALTFLMAVLSLVMAGLLHEGLDPQRNPRLLVFIVLAVAAPLAMMMLASLARPLSEFVEKLRRRRD
jgi:MFS-type transporter involved in bile tolerance (Atg22 family)